MAVGSGHTTVNGWPLPSSPAAVPVRDPLNDPPHVANGHGHVVSVIVPCHVPLDAAPALASATGSDPMAATMIPTAAARRQLVQSRMADSSRERWSRLVRPIGAPPSITVRGFAPRPALLSWASACPRYPAVGCAAETSTAKEVQHRASSNGEDCAAAAEPAVRCCHVCP